MPIPPLSPNQEKNTEERVTRLESLLYQNHQTLLSMQGELKKTREALAALQDQFVKLYKKTVTTCVQCHTDFDLLTHHYSIGLHDNLVFVKCPRCQKNMAIDRVDGLKRE